MDSEQCINPNVTPNVINEVSGYLLANYKSGVKTKLTEEQENDINTAAGGLNSLIQKLGLENDIIIDAGKLCEFIGKVLPHGEGMYGGGGDELVPYDNTRPRPNMRNIFFAILAIIISIFLFYIAFIKFDSMVQSITGDTALQAVGDINSEIIAQMRDALSLPRGDLTLLQFFFRSLQNCGTGITGSSISTLTILMQTLLKSTTSTISQRVMATCVASPTGFGTIVDNLASLATSVTSTSTVSACITTATTLEVTNFMKMTMLELTTSGNIITNLLWTSASIGTTGFSLLFYEVKKISPLLIGNRPSQLAIENGGGRKRSNKTKKTKMKKSKKYNKKRKSTRRRGKKYSRK